MEFVLALPERLCEEPGSIATTWNNLTARLSNHMGQMLDPAENPGPDSILSFVGGLGAVKKVLTSGPLHSRDEEKARELLNKLSYECLPRFLLLYERHKFFTHSQRDNECACRFLCRLREQCEVCLSGKQSQTYFRLRLAEGLSDPRMRKQFELMDESVLLGLTSKSMDLHTALCDRTIRNSNPSKHSRSELPPYQGVEECAGASPVRDSTPELTSDVKTRGGRPGLDGGLQSQRCGTDQNQRVTRKSKKNSVVSVEQEEVRSDNIDNFESGDHMPQAAEEDMRRKSDCNQWDSHHGRKKKKIVNVSSGQSSLRKELQLLSNAVGAAGTRQRSADKILKQNQRTSSTEQTSIDVKMQPKKRAEGVRTRSQRVSADCADLGKKRRETHSGCEQRTGHADLSKIETHSGCEQGKRARQLDSDIERHGASKTIVRPPRGGGKNSVDKNTSVRIRQSKKVGSDSVRAKPGPKPKAPPQEEGILPCDSCHKYFKRDWFLQCHKILKHSLPDTVQCTLCSASPFPSNAELLSHVRFQHRNGQLRYTCSICEKSFRVRAQLREHHRAEHLGRTEFSCSTCPKKFKSAKVFRRHSAQCKINSEISYPCPACGKSFSTKHKLERHERSSHTGEKPFQCTECPCRFAMKCDLTAHMKVHDQKRSRHYQCHICGKTFFERYYLPRHMLQHQGVKNFSCQQCGHLFTTNYGLRKHCWRKHGQPRPVLRRVSGAAVSWSRPLVPAAGHHTSESSAILQSHGPSGAGVSRSRSLGPAAGHLPSDSSAILHSHDHISNLEGIARASPPPQLHSLRNVFMTGSDCTNGSDMLTTEACKGHQHVGSFWQEGSVGQPSSAVISFHGPSGSASRPDVVLTSDSECTATVAPSSQQSDTRSVHGPINSLAQQSDTRSVHGPIAQQADTRSVHGPINSLAQQSDTRSVHGPIAQQSDTISIHGPIGQQSDTMSVHGPIAQQSDTISVRGPIAQQSDTLSVHGPIAQQSDTMSVHGPIAQQSDTMSVHGQIAQQSDTMSVHGPIAQQSDTISVRGPIAQQSDTMSVHGQIAQQSDTMSVHGQIAQQSDTMSVHGPIAQQSDTMSVHRPINLSAQQSVLCVNSVQNQTHSWLAEPPVTYKLQVPHTYQAGHQLHTLHHDSRVTHQTHETSIFNQASRQTHDTSIFNQASTMLLHSESSEFQNTAAHDEHKKSCSDVSCVVPNISTNNLAVTSPALYQTSAQTILQ